MPPGPGLRRRALLAGAAGTSVATGGCLAELRNYFGRSRTRQLSLTISAAPVSDDPYSARIANRLAEHLGLVGIDATVDLMRRDVLLRNVLVNHDFDLYVGRYPSRGEPDELYGLLHSTFGEEAGWQNPFGFSDLGADEHLEAQRALEGEDRAAKVREIVQSVARQQPFTVVAYPDEIAGFRTERFDGWPPGGPTAPVDYLRVERTGEADTVVLLLRDEHVTANLNPIAAEHRRQGAITGLLYEPLIRELPGDAGVTPWLASAVEWEAGDRLTATVELRSTAWHDDEPVTADDVAFTYRFLQDTSMGEFDTPAPTPWRRDAVSLVADVAVEADDRVRLTFDTSTRDIARRALALPVLPAHVWSEQTGTADLGGIDIVGQTTEALVWSNMEPVGSGRFRFADVADEEYLLLESFEDHFLEAESVPGIPDAYAGAPPFERARFRVAPSHDAAVQLLEDDDGDVSVDGMQAAVVPRISRNPDVGLSIELSSVFYHVGYNCRDDPMSNPHFRRTVARLLDREYVVANSFGGYADPAEVPYGEPWIPPELAWDDEASLPFIGSDGELDVEAARDAFRELGYQYQDGQLVRRGES